MGAAAILYILLKSVKLFILFKPHLEFNKK